MANDSINISGFQMDSIVNGENFRNVCYVQGCWWNCYMCHNSDTHAANGGTSYKIKEVIDILSQDDNEVTISGGDPLTYQIKESYELIKELKISHNKNIWVYSGYTIEQLLIDENPIRREVLKYIDVLVDGKFDISKKKEGLIFKGDESQRLIDVQKSLKAGKAIEYNLDIYIQN